MADIKTLITQMYAAFNRRDIDGALLGMTESIDWPKASEGGRVVGKEAIRAYWIRQWTEFDPHVEPVRLDEDRPGKVNVTVHQVVRSLAGDLLSDQTVTHAYTLRDGLIDRMDVEDERTPAFRQNA